MAAISSSKTSTSEKNDLKKKKKKIFVVQEQSSTWKKERDSEIGSSWLGLCLFSLLCNIFTYSFVGQKAAKTFKIKLLI